MTNIAISLLAMLALSLLLDAAVHPRPAPTRSGRGLALQGAVLTMTYGLFLGLCGTAVVAALLAGMSLALLALASNAKRRVLGEPLVFSDLALVGAMLRHPQFYFSVLSPAQRMGLAAGALIVGGSVLLASSARPADHAAGAGLAALGAVAAGLMLRSRGYAALARTPDLVGDTQRHGLLATLLLYWWRWRRTADPAPCPPRILAAAPKTPASPGCAAPERIVIVQCESFADPVAITGDRGATLPGLARARAAAWRWGALGVDGFGAYTMRTEYGVLFGRSPAALGFRQYDPFLTAAGETSHALAARLGAVGYDGIFLHPHDLRFYGRDRLMPASGFARTIGPERFDPPEPGRGRYVADRAVGTAIVDLLDRATAPTLIYAVTMENHGPWDTVRTDGAADRLDAYLRRLRGGDALLDELITRLSCDARPALLVFFGDHRPSIPGVTDPTGARDTPYVMLRLGGGRAPAKGGPPADLTPAALHHAILHAVLPQ